MNKSGDDNRSVRNTKARLYAALMALLRDRPINEISVKELTARADVNRGTFYFHYSDVYAMLGSIEDNFIATLSAVMSRTAPTDRETAFQYLTDLFRFIGDNSEFCAILLGEHGDMQFLRRITALAGEKCTSLWGVLVPSADARTCEMLNAFIINGCIGLIRFWLNSGLRETPEELSEVALVLIARGLRSMGYSTPAT